MAKILIIEDEKTLQDITKYDLESDGYSVDVADDGIKGLEMIKENNYDLAIIDWMLPGLEGIEIVKEVRQFDKKIRIIMLTALSEEMNIVQAYDLGADQFLTKPASPRVLRAMVKHLLDDVERDEQIPDTIITPRIKIDYARRIVFLDDEDAKLTKFEYDLFKYLVENKNIAVDREDISKIVWGYKHESENRSIDVYIHNIRKKLDLTNEIRSKRGYGYIFECK